MGLFSRVWRRGPGNYISEVIGGYAEGRLGLVMNYGG